MRTYAFNPSTQGSRIFGDNTVVLRSSPPSSHSPTRYHPTESQRREPEAPAPVHHQIESAAPIAERCICNPGPSLNYMPFHSPHVDPVGSIVGLRVLYIEGKLCYVPVEPQLNYLINQQFANGFCMHCAGRHGYQDNNTRNINQQQYYKEDRHESHPVDPVINNFYKEKFAIDNGPVSRSAAVRAMSNRQSIGGDDDGPSWSVSHPQPRSGVRRSNMWYGGEASQVQEKRASYAEQAAPVDRTSSMPQYNSMSTSMPNLAKRNISDSEQHKMELLRQIEENKRRREQEQERERMEEQREMERIERYNEKIRKEKEEEERKLRERAKMVERRNEQAHVPESRPRQQRRTSSPPPPPRRGQPSSPTPSDGPPPLEWWEKKPSWQQRAEDERTIPAVGAKPPRTPSRRNGSRHSTSNYDPAASVETHYERGASRASQRSEARADNRSSSAASGRRTPSRSSRSRQDTQTNARNSVQQAQESYAEDDVGGGGVARDARGRPLSFVIT